MALLPFKSLCRHAQKYTLSTIMNLVPCAKTGGALPLVIEAQEWLKARSFSASNFKREYLQCKEPRLIEHVQTQLDTFLHGCATKVIMLL